jgi:hypothetical protein
VSKPVPWRAGEQAALILALAGPEALAELDRLLPPRSRYGVPETVVPPDAAVLSAAEEKRARKATKRLKELNRV